jgi:hypothetical protein
MPNRPDWIADILLAATFVVIGIYVALPALISFNVALLLVAILLTASYAYASYWAFKIRKVLAVRIYRNQALGIGLVALGWILIFFANVFLNGGIFTAYIPFFAINTGVTFILLFYFIDASVLAGRRSDPLLRDTLHWQKLRIVLWILNILVTTVIIALITYFQLTTGTEPQFMLVYGGYVLVYIIYPVSLVALALAALRSKDKLLRAQVAWFGGFLASVLLIVDFSRVTNNDAGLILGLILGAYCLFRSARSLVPLNKVELIVKN